MAEIQFEEEEYGRPAQIEQKPFFVRLVLQTKIVSTDKQAEYVLLGFVIFCIIAAIAVHSLFGSTSKPIPWQPPSDYIPPKFTS
jgi:hypothetical protein